MCDNFPWATIASTRVPDSVMEIVIKAICAENFSAHLNHHRDIAARDQLEARDPHYNNRRRPHFLACPGGIPPCPGGRPLRRGGERLISQPARNPIMTIHIKSLRMVLSPYCLVDMQAGCQAGKGIPKWFKYLDFLKPGLC